MTPEELAKKYKQHIIDKNTITYEEFQKYLPLYNKEIHEQLSQEDKEQLFEKFNTRFDLYTPIVIMDQLDDDGKVIHTLPAMLVRVPTINNLEGVDTNDIVAGFTHAMKQSNNPISIKPAQMTDLFKRCLAQSSYDAVDDLKTQLDEYEKLADNLNIETETSINDYTNNSLWEDE